MNDVEQIIKLAEENTLLKRYLSELTLLIVCDKEVLIAQYPIKECSEITKLIIDLKSIRTKAGKIDCASFDSCKNPKSS